MKAYCAAIYGMGGSMLDPAGGMATLLAKVKALGVLGPQEPFDQEYIEQAAEVVRKMAAAGYSIILIGDSCGANKAPWVAADIRPYRVAYMACIQASVYCQAGCPDIPSTVDEAFVIYSDYAHTSGLGTYIPIRAVGNKSTKYRQSYVPAIHPDDNDVLRVQNPILDDIKRILRAS